MRRFMPLALPLLLLGCGGSGGGDLSFFQGTVGSANVQFTAGTDYNGSSAALTTLTAVDGSASSKTITLTATDNNRAVEVALIAKRTITGTTVDLAGNSGSSVLYSDPTARWSSTTGTVTVQSSTTSSITLLLTDVVLTPPSGGTAGKGSVTLNGTLSFTAS